MWHSTVGCIVILALSIFVTPLAVEAQQPAKAPRIGWLASGFPPSEAYLQRSPFLPFLQGLRELGWVEGQTLAIERRYAKGRYDRLPGLAAELVQLRVDVIVAGDSPAIRPAKQATSTIPIVMTVSGDPVGTGLIASLAQPGGNITGLTNMSPQLAGKRLELLKEAVPGVSRVAVLGPSAHPDWQELAVATQVLGVQLHVLTVQRPETFGHAFEAATREHADALLVLSSSLTNRHLRRITALAAKSQLPAMYAERAYVEAGGLMAYGPSQKDLFRRVAYYVDRILKGTKPADLPVEQPIRFELVINLKTANALGLTIPPSLLFQADEVIK